jgi:hypothetical protein
MTRAKSSDGPHSGDTLMIITTRNGKAFDTDRDLTAAERHILQKLMIWESMASSVDEFRLKRKEAMLKGWNNSGPIQESEALKSVVADLEEKVVLRLRGQLKT